LRHPSAVDVAEAGEDPPRHPEAEGVDQFLSEESLGHGIEDQGPLSGKTDEPPLRVQFEQFLQIQLFDANRTPLLEQAAFYSGSRARIRRIPSGAQDNPRAILKMSPPRLILTP